MAEALTVLIDMDGVLADFDAEINSRLQNRHPHVPILTSRTNFYISDDYQHSYPKHVQVVRDLAHEPGFFAELPLMDHALEGWQRVVDLGYNARICSAPLLRNPTCEADKRAWLAKHLGSNIAQDAVITSHKHLEDGIALIDDRPKIREASKAIWSHVVFDRPYNQQAPGARLMGWLDSNLEAVLEAAAEHYGSKMSGAA